MKSTSRRGALLLGALFAACAAPRAARAVIPFTPEGQVLLSSVTAQDVQPYAGGFRMYVTSASFAVLSATSTDQSSFGLENGVRLSTGVAGVDASSITSCAVTYITTNTVDGLRMYYVGISTAGAYSILSATSTDGLAWSKEAGVRLQRNGGAAFLDSARPLRISGTLTRLFYVADASGGNTPANYQVFSASSSDAGLTFSDEGALLPAQQAFQVSVTTLTDGRTRLYVAAPDVPGASVPTKILSAISANGTSFSLEAGVRLSTAGASLAYPVVVRSTEAWRWRMFETYAVGGSTTVSSALTQTPVPLLMNPSTVLDSVSNVPFTLTGEIFSPGPSVGFYIGADTITATSVLRPNDLTITGIINPLGRATGRRTAAVTNSDSQVGTLLNALLIDISPGTLSVVDNLIRPLHGEVCTATIQIFEAGKVTARIFTVNGGLVATLVDGDKPMGNFSFTWNGRTAGGSVVASGVYLLHATGPKLEDTKKIVVIK